CGSSHAGCIRNISQAARLLLQFPASVTTVDQSTGDSYHQRMSMPPVLTEAASPRSRLKKSEDKNQIPTSNVLQTIGQHVLLDGFRVAVELEKSSGSYFNGGRSNRRIV